MSGFDFLSPLFAKKKILVVVSASVAIYKVLDIISTLHKLGAKIRVVMSEESTKLINPLLFEALSKKKVLCKHSQSWDKKNASNHITYAKWAQIVLIAPATANTIAKFANGIADDISTCTLLACNAKKILAPAMNTAMLNAAQTQANIATLRQMGVEIIEPRDALLACGDVGKGALADKSEIIFALFRLALMTTKHCKNALKSENLADKKRDSLKLDSVMTDSIMAANATLSSEKFNIDCAKHLSTDSLNANSLKLLSTGDLDSLNAKILHPVISNAKNSNAKLLGKFERKIITSSIAENLAFWRGKEVIITGGGSSERIDSVRVMSNLSSGKQGYFLALCFYALGARVTLITSKPQNDLAVLPSEITQVQVSTSEEFYKAILESKRKCKGLPYLFMSAAIADFIPATQAKYKIKKDQVFNLELKLTRNVDILASLDSKEFIKIGFKAESDEKTALQSAKAMLERKQCLCVCLNVINAQNKAFGEMTNTMQLISKDGVRAFNCALSKFALSFEIANVARLATKNKPVKSATKNTIEQIETKKPKYKKPRQKATSELKAQ